MAEEEGNLNKVTQVRLPHAYFVANRYNWKSKMSIHISFGQNHEHAFITKVQYATTIIKKNSSHGV